MDCTGASIQEQCSRCLTQQNVLNSPLSDRQLLGVVSATTTSDLGLLRSEYTNSISILWTLLSAFVSFLILAGLALIQVAIVRSQSDNVLFKHGVAICVSGVFWVFGYVLAYGTGNPFIGVDFDWNNIEYDYVLFRWMFAIITASIVGGSLEGRIRDSAHVALTILVTLFAHAIPAHWMWTTDGWLAEYGCVDLAGAASVHVVGGLAALIGSLLLGPRLGRWQPLLANRSCVAGPQQVWYGIGTMFVWFGWFGLVAAAPRFVTGLPAAVAGARAAANVAIGGGVGGLVASLLNRVNRKTRDWDLGATCNGIMAGLVSVSAAAHVFQPWAAVVVAFLGSGIYFLAAKIVASLKIDDATEAVAVHLVCGFWAMLGAGLFADAQLLAAATIPEAAAPVNSPRGGALLGYGGYLLGVQMLAFLVILLWAGFLTFILFGILSLLNRLRLPTGHPLATEFVRRAVPPAAPLAAAKQKRAGNGVDGEESDPYEYSYQYEYIEVLETGEEKIVRRRSARGPHDDDSEPEYSYSYVYQYVDDDEAEGSGGTPVDNAVAVNQTSDAVAESESSEEETDSGADSQQKNTLAGDSDEETEDDDTSE